MRSSQKAEMMADYDTLLRRQRVLGDFGELALRSDNLQEILNEACRLVADALGTGLAKILEIEGRGNTALVRAGFGWGEGIVGQMRLRLEDRSSETFALQTSCPVVTNNIETQDRFEFAPFLKDHGVVAVVNVPILLPGGEPYGLLQVDAREPREFDDEDVAFLRTCSLVLGPFIDRLQTLSELVQSHERFRLVVEHALDHAIILSDPDDLITAWFPGAAAIFGWTEEEMLGRTVATIFTPEDQASGAPRWEVERAREAGAAPNIRWHVAKDGRRVFLDGQTIALRNEEGTLRGFLKISQDVTERKRGEDRQSVLQAELQHRVRNVLAMIASVVSRADIQGTAADLRAALSGRVAAMARTQALLTRSEDTEVDVEAMVRDELLAQSAGEHVVNIHGPAVQLSPKAAEVLTLAIHELATNAVKYGALSQAAGRIDVSWQIVAHEDRDCFDLEWQESGVDIPPATDRKVGFGTQLITRRVPYELRGEGKLELKPTGLHCRISFPLAPGDSVLQTSIPLAARTRTGASA
jgi:PAS domain S-box-containing protein